MQVDGICERDGLLYNPFLAQLLSRKEYYVLRRNIRRDVVELPEECKGRWAGAWRSDGAACGDESVVPHKGICAGPLRMFVTTKPTPDTVHSPTPSQLHVESIQLACTCALCCCYALCMKREELSIFYSLWLRCFVVMLQYVGFLGRSQLFGSQVKVGARQLQSWRANSRVGAPSWRAPSSVLARAKSGFGARQLPHSSCLFAPRAPYTLHAFPLPSRHLTTLFF